MVDIDSATDTSLTSSRDLKNLSIKNNPRLQKYRESTRLKGIMVFQAVPRTYRIPLFCWCRSALTQRRAQSVKFSELTQKNFENLFLL